MPDNCTGPLRSATGHVFVVPSPDWYPWFTTSAGRPGEPAFPAHAATARTTRRHPTAVDDHRPRRPEPRSARCGVPSGRWTSGRATASWCAEVTTTLLSCRSRSGTPTSWRRAASRPRARPQPPPVGAGASARGPALRSAGRGRSATQLTVVGLLAQDTRTQDGARLPLRSARQRHGDVSVPVTPPPPSRHRPAAPPRARSTRCRPACRPRTATRSTSRGRTAVGVGRATAGGPRAPSG